MAKRNYDFCGYCTKANVKCTDGLIIDKNAFNDCDGIRVPLIWNHQHNGVDKVLGHADLERRDDGVYAYCVFNNTENGQNAKEAVNNGDVTAMSIFANKLSKNGNIVSHGMIREVSLVLAGANPKAYIEALNVVHSEDGTEELESAQMYFDEPLELFHSEETASEETKETSENKEMEHADSMENSSEKTVKEVFDTFTEEEKNVAYYMIGAALDEDLDKENPVVQSDDSYSDDDYAFHADGEKTIGDIYNAMSQEKKDCITAMITIALEMKENENSEGDNTMKQNAFDAQSQANETTLTHSDLNDILVDSKNRKSNSLRDDILSHGIENIDYLFPEAYNQNVPPAFVKRTTTWADAFMSRVKTIPHYRVKSQFADLTGPEARARGYITGHYKEEDAISLLRRSTDPQTIYIKSKLDKDYIDDIEDFDVVAWKQNEMQGMMAEEKAKAMLFGDGRNPLDENKIQPDKIRPIYTDEDFYSVKEKIVLGATATDDQKAKAFIRACVKSRKKYKGTGDPILFTSEDMLADMLLMEDGVGRIIYDTVDKLKTALRVSDIQTVSIMENMMRVVDGKTRMLLGIIVNPADYTQGVGKKGLKTDMFTQFDIDFNQQKFLYENRCSGALSVPYSAIVLESEEGVVIEVSPVAGTETVLGKSVADLQSGVVIHDDYIAGTLKYVTGYTGFSGDPAEQNGNYLALAFEHSTGATTTISYNGRTVALDSDMMAVIRVADKNKKLVVTSTLNGDVVSKTYDLRALALLTE